LRSSSRREARSRWGRLRFLSAGTVGPSACIPRASTGSAMTAFRNSSFTNAFPRVHAFALALLVAGTVSAQPTAQPPASGTATPAGSGHVIAEIQVIPRPLGTAEDRYRHVDAAIAVIQASGLRYEVHALGTVIEGPPAKLWPLLQAVHEATLAAGAERTLSVIKVSSAAQPGGPKVEDLVRRFRP
jgi:uncharacterized protein YqgV (UPF0045/DUF77 family)